MPTTTTNAEVLEVLNAMQAIGWKKVYVTTANRPSKTLIMWMQPDTQACYPSEIARAIFRESLTESARECYGVKD